MWLTNKAQDLEFAAKRVERAYRTEHPKAVCAHVGEAYRRAANLLRIEARKIVDGDAEG
jgi:hypothetical protein